MAARTVCLVVIASLFACRGEGGEDIVPSMAGSSGAGVAGGGGRGGAATSRGGSAGSVAGAPAGGSGGAQADAAVAPVSVVADAAIDGEGGESRAPRARDADYDPVALAKLRLPPASSDQIARVNANLDQLFPKAQFKANNGVELPYRLHVPDRASYAQSAPLIVFMHGAGERGYDNRSQVGENFVAGLGTLADGERAKLLPAFILAPQCPPSDHWDAVITTTPKEVRFSPVPRPALAAAKQLVDEVIATHPTIDRRRIYVTGLSMGGFASWEMMSRWTQVFAAGVPMCSGGDQTYAAKLATMPIWVFHSTDDGNVPVIWDDTMVAALRSKGGSPRFSRLSGYGHAVWTAAWRETELFPWMFLQSL